MRLVIVESPNKRQTLEKYLGPGYKVLASKGHVRDLPTNEMGVDTRTWKLDYVTSDGKASVLKELRAAAATAEEVFLATDKDREGEAIAWHLQEALGLRSPRRLIFTAITQAAVTEAVKNPGRLNLARVDAQQARRAVDRLVGFSVSPLLRPLGSNHSAGRVQSATLHLIVQREQEREAFRALTYWTLTAKYDGLTARLVRKDEAGKLEDARLTSDTEAAALAVSAAGVHQVTDVVSERVDQKPRAPFTTASLIQAASVRLKLAPEATMKLAQALFEGGHITYHRTDSTNLSEEAITMARQWIGANHADALPDEPPRYKTKSTAQEAHEAIRPTALTPPEGLPAEELALLELVRLRFIACQMRPARHARTTVLLGSADGTTWRARGSVVEFPSFLALSAVDEDENSDDDEGASPIRRCTVGEQLTPLAIDANQRTTTPPTRFTEAGLVKELERLGIGRPSTYAATLQMLGKRSYTEIEKRQLKPTPRGRAVDAVLSRAFGDLVASQYTSEMEARLDEVEDGTRKWTDECSTWWRAFEPTLLRAPACIASLLTADPSLAESSPDAPKASGKPCPKCAAELFLRQGKNGAYLACGTYPKCDYTGDPTAKPTDKPCPKCAGPMEDTAARSGSRYARCLDKACGGKQDLTAKPYDKPCPKCSGAMEELDGKYGRYARCLKVECGGKLDLAEGVTEPCPVCAGPMKNRGEFLSCAKYPGCKGSWDPKDLESARKAAKQCPKCKTRLLRQRKGSKGKFWACSGYPACDGVEAKAQS
ncbi:type I DNA topoisomerase [Myxococcus sp. CA051A]|uniref:type I DNA topoisomerase n=1 Tax=Myxococcus sp. CA051A TaxID=2741739 RepID=UPI00157B3F64|nr:type I DNA topoisomerase [Myxococcus sp. CA051A]NTX67624.1 type I DNA topoisomerase [Myxococcus sp. CA051A]